MRIQIFFHTGSYQRR